MWQTLRRAWSYSPLGWDNGSGSAYPAEIYTCNLRNYINIDKRVEHLPAVVYPILEWRETAFAVSLTFWRKNEDTKR